ncbi:hypothetical protein SAMN04488128_1021811 [Chitinophaga eiseniae]|uniref:Uncharacterized protein n=1 Tax=Chitinophaga eiseniae TaxID=634771 RepID=A0A1T4S584_9BACT|nr:class I lanthipeptide [Chitinophaga eiseniae]SKA23383.1 hypothetical protein SAMN04488128_1021811 [Chitinophaga eiseniae]
MKKKNIDLQKKVGLKKVALAYLNVEQQNDVRGGGRAINTRCNGCDSYDPSCPSMARPTKICK